MAVGTVMPQPVFTGFDDNGNPLVAGQLFTYAAGTTTPLATYSDVNLAVANQNPVVLDGAGRAVVYLTPASYKFVLKTSAGVTLWTADSVSATPPFNVDLDVQGVAGETLTAGQVAYLSDGSGSKTVGRWYLGDADFTYASSLASVIGMVPATIASGDTGSIRLLGRVTGLSGLTVGTSYYISATAGALTSTAPTNARFVGAADSTTSLVMGPSTAPAIAAFTITGLLTLTGGQIKFPATQVPSADANTLDDYEEGTWTPGDGSGAGLTFTNVEGQYVKNGQLVTAWGNVTFPSTANGSNADLSGLPFAPASSTNNVFGGFVTFSNHAVHFRPAVGGTHVIFYLATAATRLTNANFTGETITFTVIYRASA